MFTFFCVASEAFPISHNRTDAPQSFASDCVDLFHRHFVEQFDDRAYFVDQCDGQLYFDGRLADPRDFVDLFGVRPYFVDQFGSRPCFALTTTLLPSLSVDIFAMLEVTFRMNWMKSIRVRMEHLL